MSRSVESLVTLVARDETVASKLPEKLTAILMGLQRGKEVAVSWVASDTDALALIEPETRRARIQFALAKHNETMTPNQRHKLIVQADACDTAINAIVAKSMNAEIAGFRAGLTVLNASFGEADARTIRVSGKTAKREYIFFVQERENVADEVDGILDDLGIPSEVASFKGAGIKGADKATDVAKATEKQENRANK